MEIVRTEQVKTMVKLSELRTADEVHELAMRDLEYRREYERTKLASDVAVKVVAFRADNGLSQSALARMLGWRQPNIARLEAGDHEPSLATLSRLADVLGLDFSVEVKRGGMRLRYPAGSAPTRRRATLAAHGVARGQSSGGRIPRDLVRDNDRADTGQERKRA
jgi:transcriptional regulator with XRE-family HTH domain